MKKLIAAIHEGNFYPGYIEIDSHLPLSVTLIIKRNSVEAYGIIDGEFVETQIKGNNHIAVFLEDDYSEELPIYSKDNGSKDRKKVHYRYSGGYTPDLVCESSFNKLSKLLEHFKSKENDTSTED